MEFPKTRGGGGGAKIWKSAVVGKDIFWNRPIMLMPHVVNNHRKGKKSLEEVLSHQTVLTVVLKDASV